MLGTELPENSLKAQIMSFDCPRVKLNVSALDPVRGLVVTKSINPDARTGVVVVMKL